MRTLGKLMIVCIAALALAGCAQKSSTTLRIALVPKSTSHNFWQTVRRRSRGCRQGKRR